MRRALMDIGIIIAICAVAWLAHDYYLVRQQAANGQAAAEYLNNALRAQSAPPLQK